MYNPFPRYTTASITPLVGGTRRQIQLVALVPKRPEQNSVWYSTKPDFSEFFDTGEVVLGEGEKCRLRRPHSPVEARICISDLRSGRIEYRDGNERYARAKAPGYPFLRAPPGQMRIRTILWAHNTPFRVGGARFNVRRAGKVESVIS